MPGRGLYGFRRKATDVYEDYEPGERVLNDQTGRRNSDTRREVYQEKQREEVRARSAETRRRVRSAAFGRPLQPAPRADVEPQSLDADLAEDSDTRSKGL